MYSVKSLLISYCKYLLCNRTLLLLLLIYNMTTCKFTLPTTFEKLYLIFAWGILYRLDKYYVGKMIRHMILAMAGFQTRLALQRKHC